MKKLALLFVIPSMVASVASAADFAAGRNAYIRGDFQVAYKEFLPLAHEGDAKSRVGVGLLYAKGQGVEQNDVEAHRWFTLAAQQKPKPDVFVRTVAVENRKVLARRMNEEQLAEAKRLVDANEENRQTVYAENSVPRETAKEPKLSLDTNTSEIPFTDKKSSHKREAPLQDLKSSESAINQYAMNLSLIEKGSAQRTRGNAPNTIEPQELAGIDQKPFVTQRILPGSRNGRPTTIAVIPPKFEKTKNNSAILSSEGVSSQTIQGRVLKTAALNEKPKKNVGSTILIQLGAFRDSPLKIASRAWDDIFQLHGDIIGRKKAIIVKADLGTKGVFQRLRTGPYSTFSRAVEICKQLRARNQSCFVIKSRL
tara:strand:+ start:138 stop:1241 length:1104 start_codon:yes stop_codon:yes gene_type:complete